MGVPGLFSYLRKYNKKNDQFSTIKSILPQPNENIHLYLDFNGAMYQVIKPEIKTNETLILHILEYLDNLIKIFTYNQLNHTNDNKNDNTNNNTNNNTNTNDNTNTNNNLDIQLDEILVTKLFLAIDGVPPRAKMEQQRQRRFHSICKKKKTSQIDKIYGNEFDKSSTNWYLDTNMITPGTEFMEELRQALTHHFSSNELYRNMEVIFSDWSQSGEGEHKIIRHLSKYPTPEDTKTIIYGLDGDLIMLSLATQLNNIFLLREAYEYGQYAFEHEGYPYLYMDIDCFKIGLIKECCGKYMKKPIEIITENEIDRFINDYIVLTMILGNDFMPKIPWISIKQDGHAVLLGAYYQIQNGIDYSTDDNLRWLFDKELGNLNIIMLRGIFSILSKQENKLMTKFINKRAESKIFIPRDSTEREKQQILIDFLPLTCKSWMNAEQEIKPWLPQWRSRYYSLCHRLNTHNNQDEIIKICKDYITTLLWNAKYYLCGCPSWTWYYPYSYSPTLSDIFNYLDEYKTLNHITLDEGLPTNTQTLLMMVLPKNSNVLMPKSVFKKITEDNLLDKIYFPEGYSINIPLHTRYYECTPIIPKIDIKKTEEIVNKCKLTELEEKRNMIGNYKYYKYGELICNEIKHHNI